MRIISGTHKGRTINFIKNSKTRPLKDIVRENIFNILEHTKLVKIKIKNSNILDLYSGVGSFGIEAISRGAKRVMFVDQDAEATNILKKNLVKLSIEQKSAIYNSKIESVLTKDIKEKFDIFFLDPPFVSINFFQNLQMIRNKKIFSKNHIVIIHREKKAKDNFEKFLKLIQIKHYGRSKILLGVFE